MKKGDLFNSIGVFSESLGYDAHGNITGLTRYGKISSGSYGVMDNLTLSYDGNRLTGVTETSADRYLFDGGYAKATFVNPTTYSFEFFYYNQDHLAIRTEL